MSDPVSEFQVLITEAIAIRERAIMPINPLFDLPMTVAEEETIRHEQKMLEQILVQFKRMFVKKDEAE